MDRLDAMQLYVAVVDAHSFARAAEVLGQPRSTVSRVVKELEAWPETKRVRWSLDIDPTELN